MALLNNKRKAALGVKKNSEFPTEKSRGEYFAVRKGMQYNREAVRQAKIEARNEIQRMHALKSTYGRLREKLARKFTSYSLPGLAPGVSKDPLQLAATTAIEAMFQDFQVGEFTGSAAIILLCAKCSTQGDRFPELKQVFNTFAMIQDQISDDQPLSIPALVEAAGVDPSEFAGKLVTGAIQYGQDLARMKIVGGLPDLVDNILLSASLPGREGHADKRLALEMLGVIGQTPQQSTTIQINNSTKVGVVAGGGMPQWQDAMRKVEQVLLSPQVPVQPLALQEPGSSANIIEMEVLNADVSQTPEAVESPKAR